MIYDRLHSNNYSFVSSDEDVMEIAERNENLKFYFYMGLLYKDIVRVMYSQHGVTLSERHVKRILKSDGLGRRKGYSCAVDLVNRIEEELRTSGRLHGYRWLHQKCKSTGVHCRKEDVRTIIGLLDPEGTETRLRRRLTRRSYISKGPNYIWHIDSYDKLKRFGICINGCVDGFSRHVMWLNTYKTNSDPKLIGGYYVNAVEDAGGCPQVIRCDFGTENVCVRDFQRYLRRDGQDSRAGELSYIGGASTSNQRIEYWWSFLRRECTEFWIRFFNQLQEDGHFTGSPVDVNLIQYCFMHIIQEELDISATTWNEHLIRPVRNSMAPSGKPSIMYNLPSLYGAEDYLCDVAAEDVGSCKEECVFRDNIPTVDVEMFDLCSLIMADNSRDFPHDASEATEVYFELRQEILRLLQ